MAHTRCMLYRKGYLYACVCTKARSRAPTRPGTDTHAHTHAGKHTHTQASAHAHKEIYLLRFLDKSNSRTLFSAYIMLFLLGFQAVNIKYFYVTTRIFSEVISPEAVCALQYVS